MFEFVTVSHPGETQKQNHQKRIRQHAIRNGLQNKRAKEAKRNENFVSFGIDVRNGKLKQNAQSQSTMSIAKPVSSGLLDPFDSLPGDGERLRALMVHSKHSISTTIARPY